jgi:tetratricopeptide (TPR) repeat protein
MLACAAAAGAALYFAAQQERAYRVLLARGDAALADDQTFAAIEAYSGAITIRPDSMLSHLRRGEAYQRRNELDAATLDFRAASDLDPSATRPLEALGDVLYRRGRFDAAIEAYERRLQLDSQSARVTYKLALARYRDGNVDGALTTARAAVRVSDQFADAHYLIGLCLRDRKSLKEAAAEFEKAAQMSPGLIAAREELADAYEGLGRRADALEQLQLIAMLDRAHVERQVAVGLAQARAGQEELAVLTLTNALERTPDHPLIYSAIGHVWLDRAIARNEPVFLSKALEALERAASMPAATSDVLTAYGRALWMANQVEAAERALQQATLRYPVEPTALTLYAEVAQSMNHFDAARTALAQLAALAPETP